ncbi:unnamed protein product [Polarella glacialis]|nr:unnamed protein product [Polarella glacialis]
MQPVVERGTDVANAISKVLERPRMDKAMVLFVLSDHRLPFGQLRIRSAFDKEDRRLQSAYRALGPGNRATCLYIGAGWAPAGQALLAAEVGALPRVLGNAATAIEVWLSEADLGLVMRFVNRPEVYEMPPGWPYTQQVLASPGAEHPDGLPPAEDDRTAPGEDPGMLQSYNQGSLVGPAPGDEFTLFDLNRNNATDLPEAVLAPLSPRDALAALAHRPPGVEALLVAGRRYPSLSKLQRELVKVLLETEPGRHLRFEDDENAMKALLSFHPDGDRPAILTGSAAGNNNYNNYNNYNNLACLLSFVCLFCRFVCFVSGNSTSGLLLFLELVRAAAVGRRELLRACAWKSR